MKINNIIHTFELWFLDLFIKLLSHPGLVRFWRKKIVLASLPSQIIFYSIVFSVFGVMGFLSGYVFISLQLFGSR